jgi:hypothetical protein
MPAVISTSIQYTDTRPNYCTQSLSTINRINPRLIFSGMLRNGASLKRKPIKSGSYQDLTPGTHSTWKTLYLGLDLKLCEDVLTIQTPMRLRGRSKMGIVMGHGEGHGTESGMMGSSKSTRIKRRVVIKS